MEKDKAYYPAAIVSTILFTLYLPFCVYGIWLWKQNYHHLMIKKRFPAISIGIITLSFIAYSGVMIMYWSFSMSTDSVYLSFGRSIEAVSQMVYGLITLRLFLIYVRTKRLQEIISNAPNTKDDNENTTTKSIHTIEKTKSIYYHWFSIVNLILTALGGVVTAADLKELAGLFWFYNIVTSTTLILIIICKKIKEGIGCVKETIIQLLFVILGGFLLIIQGQIPSIKLLALIVVNLMPYSQSFWTLYTPLYYIYKLNKINKLHNSNLEISDGRTTSTSISTSDITNVKKAGKLYQFLRKHANYIVFRNYCNHCWAMENLLFLQSTQIMRQIVYKYNKDKVENKNHTIHQMKFNYLTDIYLSFQNCIDEKIGTDHMVENVKFSDINKLIYNFYKEIYDEYINHESPNAVNISWEVRSNLVGLFQSGQNSGSFNSLNDYQHLFDEAVVEIYQLLNSMYNYNFQKYIDKHSTQN